ncbi:MAG: hypothetical protein JOZ54_21995 [Acidobacteria bacterium]|nr:hypothetical protein [Acidobacteriota bacterium]
METQTRKAVRIRPKSPRSRSRHRVAVFTAIDGVLLESRSLAAGENRAAIERLLAADVSVIPMSVMTLEELVPIAEELGLRQAMVIEAGAAIARWKETGWEVEPCGPPAETFLDVIREIEDRSGASLLIYSAREASEAAKISGRCGAMLHASMHRCYTEPFLVEEGDPEAVWQAAEAMGFSIRRGQRFLHLCRQCDEGEAFVRLRNELQCDLAIGVGGSLVDAEFLTRSDIAIVIPGPEGVDPELLARVPDARIAPLPAPDGWALVAEETVRLALASKRRRVAS